MVSGKQIAAVMIAATIAMTVFSPVVSTVGETTGSQDVTNETVTASAGSYVDLEGYSLDQNSETVYGYNDTSGSYEVASSGTDYEIAYDNGSIKVLNGSSLIDDGEDVKVSYTYQATSGTVTTIAQLVPLFMALLILGVLANKIQNGL